jgi:hypothetical protein
MRDRGSMACMVTTLEPLAAVVIIAAMVTPALLILASASLVATALVRMARVDGLGEQISQEIRRALMRLDKVTP